MPESIDRDSRLWIIPQNKPSRLLVAWKLEVSVDENGKEQRAILHNIGLIWTDKDFSLKEIGSNGLVVTNFKPDDQSRKNAAGGLLMTSSMQVEFHIEAHKSQVGLFVLPVVILYEVEGGDGTLHKEVHSLTIKVTNDDVAYLSNGCDPKYVQESGSDTKLFLTTDLGKIPNPEKILRKKERILNYIEDFKIPENLFNDDTQGSLINWHLLEPLTWETYCLKFDLLLCYVEFQMEYDIRAFDMEIQYFETLGIRNHCRVKVPGLAEKRPSVMRGDKLGAKVSYGQRREFEGEVVKIGNADVIVQFPDEVIHLVSAKVPFDVRFKVNHCPRERMHKSLKIVDAGFGRKQWHRIIFPEVEHVQVKTSTTRRKNLENLQFFNPLISQNAEQKLAVTKILENCVPDVPYIIFGPPGTGKTMTLVEAIKQTWLRNPNSHILAAASSNSAADLLAQRLSEDVPSHEVLRFYASSIEVSRVPIDVIDMSNFLVENDQHLQRFRIIVVTFVTAGKIASFNLPYGHFTHVFMDEAGHTVEPEALMPIAGILGNIGQIVMAGDPKQLGPVVRSKLALQNQLHISMLERLMNRTVYKPDDSTGKYNSNIITKLVQNFRSHTSILKVPSKLFYNSELEPKASPSKSDCLLNWDQLPKKGFPIIFYGVVGKEETVAGSPSFYNPEETAIVVEYLESLLSLDQDGVDKIEANDIAVISPYRGQICKIREMIKRRIGSRINWSDVTIGSTEELQGQERKVIIISTARSEVENLESDFRHNLGFLRNPKRFNVALTRAQALMIVVGNPSLLSIDPNWKIFIDYVIESGGYTGFMKKEFAAKGVSTLRHHISSMIKGFKNLELDKNKFCVNMVYAEDCDFVKPQVNGNDCDKTLTKQLVQWTSEQ